MFIAGSETSETLPLEERPEVTEKTILQNAAELLWRTCNYFERQSNELEARRHPNGYHEPDYERILREREGQVEVRIEKYDEGGGKHSWKDWLLGILALLIVGWLGRISLQMDNLTKVVIKQEVDEKDIANLKCAVYKVCP